jgi:hypothetical protein
MSITGNLRTAPDDDIRALLERPERITKLLYGGEASGGIRSLFGRKPRGDEWQPTEESEELYLDKSWEGIQFLLLRGDGWEHGGEPPLNFVVFGGQPIGDVDVGYGPARALTSQEVRTIAAALEEAPPDEFRERFDPDRMMEVGVYPEIWDRDPQEDDSLGYLIEYYTDLRDFVRRTAERGDGLLVYLN